VLEASKSGSINGVDLSPGGKRLVSGGDDRLIKLWDYNDGVVSHVGIGHSGNISRVKLCPHLKYIVSVSQDGAIITWRFPIEALE
jgi:WD40 repeat protein